MDIHVLLFHFGGRFVCTGINANEIRCPAKLALGMEQCGWDLHTVRLTLFLLMYVLHKSDTNIDLCMANNNSFGSFYHYCPCIVVCL